MNKILLIEPARAQDLQLDELRKRINLPIWSRFEAACYLLAKELLDFDEFQTIPFDYQQKLDELLENPSTDQNLLDEFQKYKTKYPDIEHLYNTFGKLRKPRLANVKVDHETNVIESAEPMAWIKLAMDNNLDAGPGIYEAWIILQLRPEKRYFPSENTDTDSIPLESQKKRRKKRPLHEHADIDNIQQLGRNIFRENSLFTKQKIAQEIREIYPRAKCYSPFVIVKWLKWASIALRKRGRPNKPTVSV